jgi:D-alanyl-D-alanine dipeptidase
MGLSATSTGPVPKNLYNELCESSRRNQSPHCPFQDVVDIATLSQEIVVDLKYSQEDNFVGEDLYGDLDVCYLREKPARMLVEAQRLLSEMKPGYLLVVYDCLRPRSVQRKMWNRVKGTPHQKYVADPDRISMHNYGAAVDVSIIDNEGHLLDMGSPFDFFGEISQPRFEEKLLEEGAITATHYRNRHLLRNLMEKAGFKSIGSEWWHFNAGDKKRIRQDYTVVE